MKRKMLCLLGIAFLFVGCGSGAKSPAEADADFQKQEEAIVNDPGSGPGSPGSMTADPGNPNP